MGLSKLHNWIAHTPINSNEWNEEVRQIINALNNTIPGAIADFQADVATDEATLEALSLTDPSAAFTNALALRTVPWTHPAFFDDMSDFITDTLKTCIYVVPAGTNVILDSLKAIYRTGAIDGMIAAGVHGFYVKLEYYRPSLASWGFLSSVLVTTKDVVYSGDIATAQVFVEGDMFSITGYDATVQDVSVQLCGTMRLT